MSSLPQDLLIIHYMGISQDPHQRLSVLGCISTLIGKPIGVYTLKDADLPRYAWNSLIDWIRKGDAEDFWRVESQDVRIIRSCQQHALVGTNQLLKDLKTELALRSTRYSNMDDIWLKARRYVETEIVQGWTND